MKDRGRQFDFAARERAIERRQIREAIRDRRDRHVKLRDGKRPTTEAERYSFEFHARLIQGLDEALRMITRHARKKR